MNTSFYGGRPGESFIIVKRFDGIDIPENTVYRGSFYAGKTDSTGAITYLADNDTQQIILRDHTNAEKFSWYFVLHNNEELLTVETIDGTPLDNVHNHIEYAQGMVQCFKKGSDTVSEVGFGQYVLIDTVSGLNKHNHLDNGKIYRRGLDYQDELGGAEYIGWFGGPKGEMPKIHLVLEESLAKYNPIKGVYNRDNKGIVPGKYLDEEGRTQYNDGITYSYQNFPEGSGELTGANLGITTPYPVIDISGVTADPYYLNAYQNLVDNLSSLEHPYYHKFKINVPAGKQGDSIKNLRFAIQITEETGIRFRPYSPSDIITHPLADNEKVVLIADQYSYLESAEGTKTNVVIGEIEWVDRLTTSIESGKQYLNLYKNSGKKVQQFNFNFVEDIEHIPNTPDIKITYSSHEAPKIIKDALKSISDVKAENNHILIKYIGQQEYVDVGEIQHITDVELTENGELSFIYNTPDKISKLANKIKWVKEIKRGLNATGGFTDELFVEYNDNMAPISLGNITPALLRFSNQSMTREEFERTPPPPSQYAQAVKNPDGTIQVYVYGQQQDKPAGWYTIGALGSSVSPDEILIEGNSLTQIINGVNTTLTNHDDRLQYIEEQIGSSSGDSPIWDAIKDQTDKIGTLEQQNTALDDKFSGEIDNLKKQHSQDINALSKEKDQIKNDVVSLAQKHNNEISDLSAQQQDTKAKLEGIEKQHQLDKELLSQQSTQNTNAISQLQNTHAQDVEKLESADRQLQQEVNRVKEQLLASQDEIIFVQTDTAQEVPARTKLVIIPDNATSLI